MKGGDHCRQIHYRHRKKVRPPTGGRQESISNVHDLVAELERQYFVATLVIKLYIAARPDNYVLTAANIV